MIKHTSSILILGGSSFIGSHLALHLRHNYKVSATYHKFPMAIEGVHYFPLDINNKVWVKRILYALKPDVVIYALGNPGLEVAERNPVVADALHSHGVATITHVIEVLQPKVIYFSCPLVFDGLKGNYKENDTLLPGSVLGRVKTSAESMIRTRCLKYIIVRCSPLIGIGVGNYPSFLDLLRHKLSVQETITLSDKETYSYGPLQPFCQAIEDILETPIKNKVFHYGGLHKLTAYQFAKAFARHFHFDERLVLSQASNKKISKVNMLHGDAALDFSLNATELVGLLNLKKLFLEDIFHELELQSLW